MTEPRPKAKDFRGASAFAPPGIPTGAAVRDSLENWAWFVYPSGWPAHLRFAAGVGIISPWIGDDLGEMEATKADALIDPTALEELRIALASGRSWSDALASALATDRRKPAYLRITYYQHGVTLWNLQPLGFMGLPPFEGYASQEDQNAILWFLHKPAQIVQALQNLEADARAKLAAESEPAEVRAVRDFAAASGKPITLEQARDQYARSQGLSTDEAARTSTPPRNTAMPVETIRAATDRGLIRMLALRGVMPAAILASEESTTRAATTTAKPGEFPAAKVATYAGAGALVGGVLGRLLGGSWTGAAIGAGLGGVAGGGAAYAMEPTP